MLFKAVPSGLPCEGCGGDSRNLGYYDGDDQWHELCQACMLDPRNVKPLKEAKAQ